MAGNKVAPLSTVIGNQQRRARKVLGVGTVPAFSAGGDQIPAGVPSVGQVPGAAIKRATRVYDNADMIQYPFAGSLQIPANPSRIYLIIQNQSATVAYVDLTGAVPPFAVGLQIAASGCWEPSVVPRGAVSVSIAANGNGWVVEGILSEPVIR
jgi:hypothetical protein